MNYTTISQRSKSELVVKKSKFIATAAHVDDEQQAMEFIKDIRKNFFDATHNVYAFTVGANDEIVRSSDDGEPSGTSGKPVLESIKSMNLKYCAVVVTRYFGGTLLGTSGLVKAYSSVAKNCLETALKVKVCLCREVIFCVGYERWNKIKNHFSELELISFDVAYEDKVIIKAIVPDDYVHVFNSKMNDILQGSYVPQMSEPSFRSL